MKYREIGFEFVELMPAKLEDGIVYISMQFATASHLCFCGCGEKVVTPFSPTDWKLMFDGETISIGPSIGSWDFPCQSHYWITRNVIHWAPKWTRARVLEAAGQDDAAKDSFYGLASSTAVTMPAPPAARSGLVDRGRRMFRRLRDAFLKR
jgi:hypothetical protein